MKKFICLFIGTFCFLQNQFSQKAPAIQWQKCIGGSADDAQFNAKILPTKSGTFVLVTTSNSIDGDFLGSNKGQYDISVIEVDINGNVLRKKNFGGSALDRAIDFDLRDDGGLVIAVESYSYDNDFTGLPQGAKFVLLAIDPNWSIVSKTILGGYTGVSFIKNVPSSNRFILTGTNGVWQPVTAVLDDVGNRLSILQYSSNPFVQNGASILDYNTTSAYNSTLVSTSGGLFSSSQRCSSFSRDYFIVDNNNSLDSIQSKCFQYNANISQALMLSQSSNAFILAIASEANAPYSWWNILDLKNSGSLKRSPDFFVSNNLSINTTAASMALDKSSNLVFCGSSNDNSINLNTPIQRSINQVSSGSMMLSSFDTASLSLKWAIRYGGSMGEVGFSAVPTPDSGYLVLGKTWSNDGDVSGNHGGGDLWLVKLSSPIICPTFNPFPDTIRSCTQNVVLDAGIGYNDYKWSNGAVSQKINVSVSGKYSVSASNSNGCSGDDTTYLSVNFSNIIQSDTVICKGSTINLNVDSAIFPKTEYLIGDRGPAGGIVFFDKGVSSEGWRYLEAAPFDLNGSFNWACSTIPVETFASFGYGAPNTKNILSSNYFCSVGSFAASACDTFSYGGYYDWYLPNTTELLKMGSLSNLIGGFPPKNSTVYNYWSSNQFDLATPRRAWVVNINGDASVMDIDRSFSVRTIRRFDVNPNVSLVWSNGNTSSQISVTPTKSSKYYLTVSNGISTCIDSIMITVLDVDTSLVLLDSQSACLNSGSIRLQAGVSNTYSWLKDGVLINGANSRIYGVTSTGSYRVITGSAQGCSDTSRAISVVVNPKPVPNFTVNASSQCSSGNQFVFTNTSTISTGSLAFSWFFGDGTSSDSISPSKSYLSEGIYNVKLIATSDKLCKDSITKQVTVIKDPEVPTISSPSDELCTGSTLVLTTNGKPSLQWFRNGVLISGATGTSLSITSGGDYSIVSTSATTCKSTSIIKTIVENPTPDGILDNPLNLIICEGFATRLVANGASSYQWYFNSSPITGATSSTYDALLAGTYSVDFISDKGCVKKSPNKIILSEVKKPKASFVYNSYCKSVPTIFTSTSEVSNSGTVQYSWNLESGISGSGQSLTYTFASAVLVNAKLVVTPTSCPQLADSLIKAIQIESAPVGIIYPNINAVLNKPKPISARAIGSSYLWQPASDLSNPNRIDPILTATAERFYRIFITNQAGCLTIDTQYVKIFKDRDIYVPKAYSPNGDGQNDRLYPIPVGIKEMTVFRIYSRWGSLLFDNKAATASTGWDGTFNGKLMPIGTYTWIAEGIDDDGNIIRRSGNTVLVR